MNCIQKIKKNRPNCNNQNPNISKKFNSLMKNYNKLKN